MLDGSLPFAIVPVSRAAGTSPTVMAPFCIRNCVEFPGSRISNLPLFLLSLRSMFDV